MFRVAAGTGMTPEILSEYIGKHKQEVIKRYQKLHDAYVNDYEIFHLLKKAAYKPDNRISVNFAKYITDTMNGFFIGIPIKTTNTDEVVSNYIDFLDQYNDQDDNNAELSKICSIYGKGYEMYYNDTEGNIGITYLTPLEAFFIYDDSILERPLYFVRYYLDADNVERGSWSDGSIVQHFVQDGSYRWDGEAKEHRFEGVPATEFIENDERVGIFEGAMPMIDAYNKALSEKANDVDYFADAYLKVLGQRLEKEDVQHIRDDEVTKISVAESTEEALENVTVMSHKFLIPYRGMALMHVIGPVEMDYRRMVSLVNVISRVLVMKLTDYYRYLNSNHYEVS